MPKLTYHVGRVVIETPYDPVFVDELKELPSRYREWNQHNKTWTVWRPHVIDARTLVLAHWPFLQEVNKELYEQEIAFAEAAERARREQQQQSRDYFRNQREHENRYDQEERFRAGNSQSYRQQTAGSAYADPDFAALHLLSTAPEHVFKAAYKALALKHHSDLTNGGNEDAIKAINAAADNIRKRKGWSK